MTEIPKYLERQLDGKWPRLLIQHDKHSTSYTLISKRESLWTAALQILKERLDIGYIGKPEKKPYKFDEKLDAMTVEQINALPLVVRETTIAAKQTQDRYKNAHREEVEEWKAIQDALKQKDGISAWIILVQRSDHEYERIEFKPFDGYL